MKILPHVLFGLIAVVSASKRTIHNSNFEKYENNQRCNENSAVLQNSYQYPLHPEPIRLNSDRIREQYMKIVYELQMLSSMGNIHKDALGCRATHAISSPEVNEKPLLLPTNLKIATNSIYPSSPCTNSNLNSICDNFHRNISHLHRDHTVLKIVTLKPDDISVVKFVTNKRYIGNCFIICGAFGIPNLTLIFPNSLIKNGIKKLKIEAKETAQFKDIFQKFLNIACGSLDTVFNVRKDFLVKTDRSFDFFSHLRNLEKESLEFFHKGKRNYEILDYIMPFSDANNNNFSHDNILSYDKEFEQLYFSPLNFARKLINTAKVKLNEESSCTSFRAPKKQIIFSEGVYPSDIISLILLAVFNQSPITFFNLKQVSLAWYYLEKFKMISAMIHPSSLQRYITLVHSVSEEIAYIALKNEKLFRLLPRRTVEEYLAIHLDLPRWTYIDKVKYSTPGLCALFDYPDQIPIHIITMMEPDRIRVFLENMPFFGLSRAHAATIKSIILDEYISENFEANLRKYLKSLFSATSLGAKYPELNRAVINGKRLPREVMQFVASKHFEQIVENANH